MLHPNSLFYKYRESIKKLESFDKDNIQCAEFELYHEPNLKIYYAPHNEYINANAKILIVGITPGWSQTQRAYQKAQYGISQNWSDEEICYQCKMESRFAGSMRKNLITMLDELHLQEMLALTSCSDLFKNDNDLLHTTSLIKYPCFYKGKNYSGHVPAIGSSDILRKYVQTEFAEEVNCLSNVRLIIPLGAAVENIIREMNVQVLSQDCNVLWGFPHPSGLNVRRKDQFALNRESMSIILRRCNF